MVYFKRYKRFLRDRFKTISFIMHKYACNFTKPLKCFMKIKFSFDIKQKSNFIKEKCNKVIMMLKFNQLKKKWGEKMIDKITQYLTNKIRQEMPDVDDERAEVINYGLQILLGEVPKFFIMLMIAYLLGVLKLSLITFIILMPYRGASGGFHLKTHIGCTISTCTFYCGIAILAQNILLAYNIKYIFVLIAFMFGISMIKLYAPADTEEVPIISEKIRKQKQILSYIFLTVGLIIAAIINNNIISNIIIFGYILQTCMITRIAYRITNNKYGYEVYENTSN